MSTIKDVAKLAGVSNGTVSKVINNYPLVSTDTRNKVLQAIDELHYIPNQLAASLSSKNKDRIALLIKNNENEHVIDEISMQYIIGATSYAHQNNIDVVTVFSSELGTMSWQEIKIYLLSLSITGIIIYSSSQMEDKLQKLIDDQSFKCVIINGYFTNKSTGSIMIDHQHAQTAVADAMLKSNPHIKNILYIAGKKDDLISTFQIQEINQFARAQKMRITIVYGNYSESQAYQLALEHAQDADAIICASDLMAIGSKRAVNTLNIERPITGFNGIKLMAYLAEDVLTVKQDFFLISQLALTEILSYLNEERQPRLMYVDYAIQTIKLSDVTT